MEHIDEKPASSRVSLKRVIGIAALLAVLVLAGIFGVRWWTHGRFVESTDDAYLRADTVTVAPRVAGYVSAVLVADNRDVSVGQALVRIDPAPLAATLARQTADREARGVAVTVAEAQLARQRATVAQGQARLAGDDADLAYANGEVARYRGLVATGAETREKLADLINRRDRAQATRREDAASLDGARRESDTMAAQIAQARAQVDASAAAVHQAQLDVDNTLVRAGIAGRVGDRTVAIGQYVQPGTRMMTLVPIQDIYVVANFKETQLAGMHVGMRATVSVDALDGHDIEGVVDSFAPGTGSQFALLPADNATGNFTKIVQRVPVRIRLDADAPTRARLVPGLSATVSIDTHE